MFRRLSTKWVLTVLAAVIVPFLGYAWFLSQQMKSRESEVVRYLLNTLATDLADRVDHDLNERIWDVQFGLAKTPMANWAAEDDPAKPDFEVSMTNILTRFCTESHYYDRALLVDRNGHVLLMNQNPRLAPDFEQKLRGRDLSKEPWFRQARSGQIALVDQHVSDLLPADEHHVRALPESYHIGIAAPVPDILEPSITVGVVYVLVNWGHFQKDVIKPPRPALNADPSTDIYASCYSWLWKYDCDTIIAHRATSLYRRSVARDTGLPQLVNAARAKEAGMFPDYVFRGVEKKAAFKHCRDQAHGGLGWVVGVGIDDVDTFVRVQELRRVLIIATILVLGTVLVLTIAIARRTTAAMRCVCSCSASPPAISPRASTCTARTSWASWRRLSTAWRRSWARTAPSWSRPRRTPPGARWRARSRTRSRTRSRRSASRRRCCSARSWSRARSSTRSSSARWT